MKKILFCRSGGGAPGIDVHIGIWKALESRAIESTANSGTSAGAVVSAFDSSGYSANSAEKIVRSLVDKDFRKERFLWKVRGLWGGIDWFLFSQPVLRILKRYLPGVATALLKPLRVWFTRERDSVPVCSPDDSTLLLDEIYASMAIPAVFPPVALADEKISDGGTTNYLALPPDWREYDEVYLLIACPPYEYEPSQSSMMSRFLMATNMMLEQQIRDTLNDVRITDARRHRNTVVHVVRPVCGRDAGMLRFNHDLIDEAAVQTCAILDNEQK